MLIYYVLNELDEESKDLAVSPLAYVALNCAR